MLPNHKSKALAGLKRLNGLSHKVEELIEEDTYCPEILRNVLAMKGHVDHVQAQVLESHLHTCAPKKLASKTDHDSFVKELLKVIGLSSR
jgi:CsoR family transcriptional regulator, copper-sensing transcriptional repressor